MPAQALKLIPGWQHLPEFFTEKQKEGKRNGYEKGRGMQDRK